MIKSLSVKDYVITIEPSQDVKKSLIPLLRTSLPEAIFVTKLQAAVEQHSVPSVIKLMDYDRKAGSPIGDNHYWRNGSKDFLQDVPDCSEILQTVKITGKQNGTVSFLISISHGDYYLKVYTRTDSTIENIVTDTNTFGECSLIPYITEKELKMLQCAIEQYYATTQAIMQK